MGGISRKCSLQGSKYDLFPSNHEGKCLSRPNSTNSTHHQHDIYFAYEIEIYFQETFETGTTWDYGLDYTVL